LAQLKKLAQLKDPSTQHGFESSLAIVARGVALPLYPQMTEADQDEVIAAVRAVLA
jgi:dTDP-4-amino-4,6-dideoxygalactose transaminase